MKDLTLGNILNAVEFKIWAVFTGVELYKGKGLQIGKSDNNNSISRTALF